MVALTVVSVGVAVTTVTDLQFVFFGACVALAWIIPSAVNKILWSNLQQQQKWTALAYVSCSSELVWLRGINVACEKRFYFWMFHVPFPLIFKHGHSYLRARKYFKISHFVNLLNRLMWKTTPITLVFLVFMIPLDPPGLLAFHWSFGSVCFSWLLASVVKCFDTWVSSN